MKKFLLISVAALLAACAAPGVQPTDDEVARTVRACNADLIARPIVDLGLLGAPKVASDAVAIARRGIDAICADPAKPGNTYQAFVKAANEVAAAIAKAKAAKEADGKPE